MLVHVGYCGHLVNLLAFVSILKRCGGQLLNPVLVIQREISSCRKACPPFWGSVTHTGMQNSLGSVAPCCGRPQVGSWDGHSQGAPTCWRWSPEQQLVVCVPCIEHGNQVRKSCFEWDNFSMSPSLTYLEWIVYRYAVDKNIQQNLHDA